VDDLNRVPFVVAFEEGRNVLLWVVDGVEFHVKC
jgi:hypothetical protein